MRRIAIVGASSVIAEHCARLWVREVIGLVLIGRDLARLERIAADLRVRSPQSQIECVVGDFADGAKIAELVDAIHVGQQSFDIVLVAHGSLPDQRVCQENLPAAQQALEVNAVSPALFAEAFAQHMAKAGRGTIAVIGSVAGDRGRRSNYTYGAAKALIDCYLAGMRHRFANTGVRVVTIKPGPTDTPMTAHLKDSGMKLAEPSAVAADIVNGIAEGRQVIYSPFKWSIIMLIIRNLPGAVFNRMNI